MGMPQKWIWAQTVCGDYQRTRLVGIELIHELRRNYMKNESEKHSVLCLGHRQTVQIQIWPGIFTLCLQKVLLKFGKNEKYLLLTPFKLKMGKVGNFGHRVNSDIHLQIVEIKMRRLLMSRLIRIFTVCLVNLLFYYYNQNINKQGRSPNLPDVRSYLTLSYW